MILDYNYHKQKRQLSVSYINEHGAKALLRYNVSRFKTYYENPSGRFDNWNGKKCDIKYTEKPGWTEFKTFIEELPTRDKLLLLGKTNPKLYTFDIEVAYDPTEFPEPGEAKFPILTISIVNENLDAVVLGIKKLNDSDRLQNRYEEWLNTSEFYKKLGLSKPKVKYIYFESEGEMLKYFLEDIVSKCPVLAGWNSLAFDWQYIQNRVKNYYPDISFSVSSMDRTMGYKSVQDFKGNKIRLSIPHHTLVLDMMDIIGTFDMAVMPIKESLSLDYISFESIGMGKIKYDGDLNSLYESDYATYVFYNMIDSVLVQLIDKRFKTLSILYTQSLLCRNTISTAFSKIAITESMFFNHFFENGIKIVPSDGFSGDRGKLVGAYVRQTTAGKHMYVCCNDFASLYPSVIISCNLSIENYMGCLADGTFTEADLERYRKDPNYFVSINGCVYKNDKDYSFKIIQRNLKTLRAETKYLSKQLDATVMSDLEHIKKKMAPKNQKYSEEAIEVMKELGFDVKCTTDLYNIDLKEFERLMTLEINFMVCKEQAVKLIMNSMYGGSSHVAFEWFNIFLANDITGEGRTLINIMENHIPKFFQDNWLSMTDLHKQLGITLKQHIEKADIQNISEHYIKDLGIFVQPVAGDTDSIYFCYEGLLNTIEGIENMSITERARIIERINTEYLNQANKKLMTEYYRGRNIRNVDTDMVHEFELETIAYSELRLDVKKRYSQMLIWKDGKYFDEDNLKSKTKGLEMVKASYPAPARKILTKLTKTLLLSEDPQLIHILNNIMRQGKVDWDNTPINDISPAISVNDYNDYVISDDDPTKGPEVNKGCPFQVRGLAYYNWIRQTKGLIGDPLYGGKMKYYIVDTRQPKKKSVPNVFFTFQPNNLPDWSQQYAPIDRNAMFQKCVIDPFNRILEAARMQQLNINGYIPVSLFD